MAVPVAARRWLRRALQPLSQAARLPASQGSCPSRRCWASSAAEAQLELQQAPPWLWVRAQEPPGAVAPPEGLRSNTSGVPLDVAGSPDVVSEALRVTYLAAPHSRWRDVVARLRQVELDAVEAVLILHCMVKLDYFDEELLSKVVDRIECRYFSMELGLEMPQGHKLGLEARMRHHEFLLNMFEHAGNYQSLVNALPLSHKVKLILLDSGAREPGEAAPEPPAPEVEPKKRWKTVDPIEMEAWEREQFEKGRLRVKRMRHVEAQVTKMRPGNKLRAALGVQLMQVVPRASPAALAQIAQVFTSPKLRVLHGDLQDDMQEQLARKVTALDTHQVVPYILAFTSAMRDFAGPEAYRCWRRKLLPAAMRLSRSADVASLLDSQRHFHPQLRGVPHFVGPPPQPAAQRVTAQPAAAKVATSSAVPSTARAPQETTAVEGEEKEDPKQDEEEEEAEEEEEEADEDEEEAAAALASASMAPSSPLAVRADRAAQLLVAVCTARQVRVDTELFDALARPLKALLIEWLGGAGAATDAEFVLPLETLADTFAASVASGVDDAELGRLLAEVFLAQFSADLSSSRPRLSAYAAADVCNLAHGAALLCDSQQAAQVLDLVWAAVAPKLKAMKPHLRLMALNAIVRGSSESVLTSPALSAAVDEFLVQRLDFDAKSLGRIGF